MITNLSITDMYMGILSSLTNDEKLDLIAKLSESMREKRKPRKNIEDIFACFHEDWGGDGTPEEIAEDLRKSRVFTREIEEW